MPFIWIDKGVRIPAEKESEIKTFRPLPVDNPGIQVHGHAGPLTFANRLAQHTYDKGQHPLPERHRVIRAEEIMSSPVVTLPPSTTLTQAWVLIRDHRFRHVPIVDANAFPLGILSDRSLLRAAVTIGRDITRSDDGGDPAQTIGSLFSRPVLTALPHAEIHQIAKTLLEKHVGAMPIIDPMNRLIGIITRSDILRALVQLGPLDLWG